MRRRGLITWLLTLPIEWCLALWASVDQLIQEKTYRFYHYHKDKEKFYTFLQRCRELNCIIEYQQHNYYVFFRKRDGRIAYMIFVDYYKTLVENYPRPDFFFTLLKITQREINHVSPVLSPLSPTELALAQLNHENLTKEYSLSEM